MHTNSVYFNISEKKAWKNKKTASNIEAVLRQVACCSTGAGSE
jgi:hypothetical protein